MARSIDAIQRDLERTRSQLSSTLDELAVRSNPSNLANDAKSSIAAKLQDPKVQAILAGVGVAVVGIIALSVNGKRKRSKELKEIQKLLKAHRG